MKKELNKWQYGLEVRKCPPHVFGFYPYIRLWFLKFTSFPTDKGEMFSKEHYRGLFWEWHFKRHIVVTTRTFRLPMRLRIFLALFKIKTYNVYVLPTWLRFIK